MEFDHIGVPAASKRDGMRFLESKRLWLTSPADHAYRVEWLWYEPDSPEAELIRTVPHVAYLVDSLEEEAKLLVNIFFHPENARRFVGIHKNHFRQLILLMKHHCPRLRNIHDDIMDEL